MQSGRQRGQNRQQIDYVVTTDGTVKIPIVGQVKLNNLTVLEAEKILQHKFDEYYKNTFVKLKYLNKRIILLGALGGQVIPLTNENMTLIELIALSGGMQLGSKAQNIKIIRGQLTNPEVYQVI